MTNINDDARPPTTDATALDVRGLRMSYGTTDVLKGVDPIGWVTNVSSSRFTQRADRGAGVDLAQQARVRALGPWLGVLGVTVLGLVATIPIGPSFGALFSIPTSMALIMLPDAAATAEIGESWRHLGTIGVLVLWAVVGLAVAPVVLRRMARRESGSTLAARREKAMQRVR